MKRRVLLAVLSSVGLICNTHNASAQFAGLNAITLDVNMGGFRSQVLSQNVASTIKRVGDQSRPAVTAIKPLTLRFPSNAEFRRRNLAKFVDNTRQSNPSGADQMEKLFASTDVIAMIGQGLAPFGLRTDNVADAYTVYWMSAWQASAGSTATPSRAQVTKVKQQVTQALLATPEITGASNAQKQEFAEALLVQTALIDASMEQAAGDANQKRAIASAVRKGASAMGLDLDAMTLTEDGFAPANEGSSVDDRDIPRVPGADSQQKALAANNDATPDSSPNYALIAAAGGAGLGGMLLLGKAMVRKR